MLAGLPKPPPKGASVYAAAVRVLIERLAAGGPVRLNGGGERAVDEDGGVWESDRGFAFGGFRPPWRSNGRDGERDPVAGTMRWFGARERRGGAGYRIPLPKGRYSIEFVLVLPPWRREREEGRSEFLALAEGREIRAPIAPAVFGGKRRGKAQVTVAVEDGVLDLEFRGEGAESDFGITAIVIHCTGTPPLIEPARTPCSFRTSPSRRSIP